MHRIDVAAFKYILLVAAIAMSLPMSGSIGLLREIDTLTYAWHFPSGDPVDVPIVFIDYTNATADYLGHPDLRRESIAALIEKLMPYRPAVVAIDAYFPDRRDAAGDQALVEVARRYRNLVFGAKVFGKSFGDTGMFPELTEARPAAGYLDAQSCASRPGILDGIPVVPGLEGQSFPEVIAQLYLRGKGIRAGSVHGTKPRSALESGLDTVEVTDCRLINFSASPKTIRRLEFHTVLSGAVHPDDFSDKIVLVGFSAKGKDLHLAPIGKPTMIHGTQIVYFAVVSAAQQSWVRLPTSPLVPVFLILVLPAAVVWIGNRMKSNMHMAAFAVALPAVMVISQKLIFSVWRMHFALSEFIWVFACALLFVCIWGNRHEKCPAVTRCSRV